MNNTVVDPKTVIGIGCFKDSGITATVPVGTEARVCADITRRQAMGIKKYGTTVAENPLPLRAWLQHAYEETLDQAIYLKRAMEELELKEEDGSW